MRISDSYRWSKKEFLAAALLVSRVADTGRRRIRMEPTVSRSIYVLNDSCVAMGSNPC